MPLLPETRLSLLARLGDASNQTAWLEFSHLYCHAIYRFARARSIQPADAEDVVQEVMLAVSRIVPHWESHGRAGAFRTWLAKTIHRTCLAKLRAHRQRSSLLLEKWYGQESRVEIDEEDASWREWAFVWAAGEIEAEVKPQTWQAFWRTAVAGESAEAVAHQLEMTIGAVYAAKCRTLARIRERVSSLEKQS